MDLASPRIEHWIYSGTAGNWLDGHAFWEADPIAAASGAKPITRVHHCDAVGHSSEGFLAWLMDCAGCMRDADICPASCTQLLAHLGSGRAERCDFQVVARAINMAGDEFAMLQRAGGECRCLCALHAYISRSVDGCVELRRCLIPTACQHSDWVPESV